MTNYTNNNRVFEETATISGFQTGDENQSFEAMFEEACTDMSGQVDPMRDIQQMVRTPELMAAYKNSLLKGLMEESAEMESDDTTDYGAHRNTYAQVSQLFDNCVSDMITESTVGQLLPIKSLDLPILVKEHLKLATKDIMQTEVTTSPIVKKHIEQTYIFDNNNPDVRFKYPQCFFSDDWEQLYAAGKGLPLKSTPVELPIFEYNIPQNLTDSTEYQNEAISFNSRIVKVVASVTPDGGAAQEVTLTLKQPIRISLQDNKFINGKIDEVVTISGKEYKIQDEVTGSVNFRTNTVNLAAIAGIVKKVIFEGFLSNERNINNVGFDYEREEMEWKIEDGSRANVPYTIETLEDTKALLNMDLYKKTYNNIGEYLAQIEDSDVLRWLDEQFDKYKGIEVDPLDFDGFITEATFDCDSTSITTALPNQYISEMLKFKIDRLLVDMADTAKMEGLTFVIYGSPRIISFLNPYVNWVTRSGSSSNGVKLDYSYGIMTSNDVKVQVVSTKKVNVKFDSATSTHKGMRIIPFPTSNEQMTFKHYKWTTHILTGQNSGYTANVNKFPGGTMTNICGVSRYTNAAVQGIQTDLALANAAKYIEIRK